MPKIPKFPVQLKELRVHLCQSSEASKGARNFIEQFYTNIKSTNPNFPILVRECSGVEPRIWARFEKGKETSVSIANLDAEGVLNKLNSVAQ